VTSVVKMEVFNGKQPCLFLVGLGMAQHALVLWLFLRKYIPLFCFCAQAIC
jgi:hypothetical protein